MNTETPHLPNIDEVFFAILEDYSLFELKNAPTIKEDIKLLYALNDTEAECLISACWEVKNGRKLPRSYRECFKTEL
ncbi:hypothetical protein EBR25_11245 [bacterium]|nr:hypothetical protein [bacterium]